MDTPADLWHVVEVSGTDFCIGLSPLTLEAGATIKAHVVQGWCDGPTGDAVRLRDVVSPSAVGKIVRRTREQLREIARNKIPLLDDSVPTVLVVHALTGNARAGGEDGYWRNLIGPGKVLDTNVCRVLSFNLLGSCYGTSGPLDEGFPSERDDQPPPATPNAELPATITTWDQAQSILMALDALGIGDVCLTLGGSLGGMVTLTLAALAPHRFKKIMPIAACAAASSWLLAFNHVGRQAILTDPGFPDAPTNGLHLARQLAMISYRHESGLDQVQGVRAQRQTDGIPSATSQKWSAHNPYRIQTYLNHMGDKLLDRFHARSYLALLGAMDHHDLGRRPNRAKGDWTTGLDRIRAQTCAVAINTDQLFLPHHSLALSDSLRVRGVDAECKTLSSLHGHDGFLVEFAALGPMIADFLNRT